MSRTRHDGPGAQAPRAVGQEPRADAPEGAGTPRRAWIGLWVLACALGHNSLVGAAEVAWQPVLDDPLGALSAA